MVLLTTFEYMETPNRVIIDIDYSFDTIEEVYESNSEYEWYKNGDDIVLYPYVDLFEKILIIYAIYIGIAILGVVIIKFGGFDFIQLGTQ